MSDDVRTKWAKPDRRVLIATLTIAPVGLIALILLGWAAALASQGLL